MIDSTGRIGAVQGSPTDCVLVSGTSTPCSSGSGPSSTLWPNFAGGEIPVSTGGLTYSLVHTPDPAPLLQLWLNGLFMTQNVDYTLSGNVITFVPASAPQTNSPADVLIAAYQYGVQSAGSTSFLTAVTNYDMIFVQSASGSPTAYTGCPVNVPQSLPEGTVVNWVPDVNATGGMTTTFNFCGLGILAIAEANGSSNPTSTDIVAGHLYSIWFDGTEWRLPATSGAVACSGLPALTGDLTTSAGSCATTLASTAVAAGSYTNANITVDAKGRVTAAANGSSGSSGALVEQDFECSASSGYPQQYGSGWGCSGATGYNFMSVTSGAAGFAYFAWTVPHNWVSGAVTFSITFEGSGSGNTLQFNIATGYLSSGTVAFNAPQLFPSQATSGSTPYTVTSPALTMTGMVADHRIVFEIGYPTSGGQSAYLLAMKALVVTP